MTQFIQVNGVPAPITKQGVVRNVPLSIVSARTATPVSDNVKAVVIAPDQDCWFLLGDKDVSVSPTTGSKIFAGSYYFALVSPGDYVAFVRTDTDGSVNITECAP